MANDVVVPVKSAWISKINITQAVALLATLLATFGVDMPEDVRVGIITAITAATTILTWVLRTWFTKSVTRSAMR